MLVFVAGKMLSSEATRCVTKATFSSGNTVGTLAVVRLLREHVDDVYSYCPAASPVAAARSTSDRGAA